MLLIHFFKDFLLKFRQNDATSKNVFDHYFFDLKYYLHKDASIEDFSTLLNIYPEQLDQISRTFYNSSFEILLNEHRYIHFINELESPVNSNLSFESIIKLCGYEDNSKFVEYVNEKNTKSYTISKSF
jgi:AraC-like DNA-binding protein